MYLFYAFSKKRTKDLRILIKNSNFAESLGNHLHNPLYKSNKKQIPKRQKVILIKKSKDGN